MAQMTRRGFVAGSAVTAGLMGMALGACGTSADGSGAAGGEDIYAAPDASAYPIEPDAEGVQALWTAEELPRDGWTRVANGEGKTLGVADASKLIQVSGLAFKDLNGNGKLDLWEDWRQPATARAAALAESLTIEECAPLMFHGDFSLTGSSLEDTQIANVEKGQRAGVIRGGASGDNYAVGVAWTNDIQARCEALNGIPYWNSADPYRFWDIPDDLTLAATFDPDVVRKTANYLAMGWRSVGITCELGPEVDVTTNPGYNRFSGCFSDDPALTRDLARAFADGLQSTYDGDEDLGWGEHSVSAMFKHYPGDAACEGGRNSHNRTGEFMAFPNDNLGVGLVPYIDGGLRLEGKTGQIASIMPNYAVCYTEDGRYGENVATAYNKFVLSLIRDAGWDGVICTDWQITQDSYFNGAFEGRHFGVDDLTPEERIAKGYQAGTDQFGGEFQPDEIPAIIKLVQGELGEDGALALYQAAARRLFEAELNLGLFENAYLDREETKAIWEQTEASEYMAEVLPKCVVMLKNRGGVIKAGDGSRPKVYVPMIFSPGSEATPMGGGSDPSWSLPADAELLGQYFDVVTDTVLDPSGTVEVYKTGGMEMGPNGPVITERDPDEVPEIKQVYTTDDIQRAAAEDVSACDLVLVFASGPTVGSGSQENPDGTVTYLPMNLTYGPYTADGPNVRQVSVGGEALPDGTKENRSYYGQTNPGNTTELDKILAAKALAGDKLVVVAMSSSNPMIFSEFEDQVDAILYTPLASDGASIAKIVAGEVEPSGLLPFQMPADMDTVEANAEDTPRDLDCYVDSEGNAYDFAFGLN